MIPSLVHKIDGKLMFFCVECVHWTNMYKGKVVSIVIWKGPG